MGSESFGPPFKAHDSALIDALPVAIYVCDRHARIVGFNRRAVELWGREPAPDERFCGSLRMIRPDGSVLPHDACPMADVLRTGETVRDAGVVVERPDGSRVSVNVAIVPLTDASGQVTGAINTFQDVGELARAYEAVYGRERELHDFVENATEGSIGPARTASFSGPTRRSTVSWVTRVTSTSVIILPNSTPTLMSLPTCSRVWRATRSCGTSRHGCSARTARSDTFSSIRACSRGTASSFTPSVSPATSLRASMRRRRDARAKSDWRWSSPRPGGCRPRALC